MSEILAIVMNLPVVVFVIASMLVVGASLTALKVTAAAAQPASTKVPIQVGPS